MKLMQGDCLDLLATLEPGSVDMVTADPPYGTTQCKWDSIIPLEPLWWLLKRIIKPNGAIVMMAGQPFTSALVRSNLPMFKYCWVWEKTLFSNFALVKKQPAKKHEDVVVFYKKQPIYNPIMEAGAPYSDKIRSRTMGVMGDALPLKKEINNPGIRYPGSVQKFSNGNNKTVHPTQKPVALMEYMIKTYTNPGQMVLDFSMGSGTTGVAAVRTGREFIGIELDEKHFNTARDRINLEIIGAS